jgi:hypothetical protein
MTKVALLNREDFDQFAQTSVIPILGAAAPVATVFLPFVSKFLLWYAVVASLVLVCVMLGELITLNLYALIIGVLTVIVIVGFFAGESFQHALRWFAIVFTLGFLAVLIESFWEAQKERERWQRILVYSVLVLATGWVIPYAPNLLNALSRFLGLDK